MIRADATAQPSSTTAAGGPIRLVARTVVAQEVGIVLIVSIIVWGVVAGTVEYETDQTGGAGVSALWVGVWLAGLLSIGWLIRRALKIAVTIDSSGIQVDNFWRRRHVAWRDIARVRKGWIAIGPAPTRTIVIDRQGGGAISILAVAESRGKQRQLMDILRARPELAGVDLDQF